MAKAQILIVEDDQDLREALVTTLELAKFRVREAANAEQALAKLAESPVDMVVSDVNMPGMSGHDLLHEIQRRYPGLPTMLITAYGQISHAVSAMQSGAIDYLVKPFEPSVLVDAVTRVVGGGRQKSVDQPVAEDPISKRMFQLAAKVAASDSTVMISGESGTGKEVLARYIHQQSPRSDQAFVAINCAAIPENMLEAILFGHEKGAFTGAVSARTGLIEAADGGSLFLDEIGELPAEAQARLLRVLQEGEIRKVGSTQSRQVDVRMIAATHRNLKAMTRTGGFREDLFYRLNVMQVRIPPLRERQSDILGLAQRFLQRQGEKMSKPGLNLTPEAMRALERHRWPGNVRELENAIERATILCDSDLITPSLLDLDGEGGDVNIPETLVDGNNEQAPSREAEATSDLSLEDYFQHFVLENQDRMSETELAQKLGISRKSLWERRQRLGIPRKKSSGN